jgi:predicted anti-sigma-YlaC factor YlaD
MDCSVIREAISARLDGEESGLADELCDAHLAGCADCRAWAEAAAALRGAAGRAPRPDVALDPALLAALTSPADPERQRGVLSTLEWRALLAVVAVVQVIVAWPGVMLHDGHASVHIAHELTAWDVGLPIGFLVAVVWPARSWGMLPLASVLVACMAGISVLDALSGHALLGREIVHLLQIAGLGCLWALARRHGRPSAVVRLA